MRKAETADLFLTSHNATGPEEGGLGCTCGEWVQYIDAGKAGEACPRYIARKSFATANLVAGQMREGEGSQATVRVWEEKRN